MYGLVRDAREFTIAFLDPKHTCNCTAGGSRTLRVVPVLDIRSRFVGIKMSVSSTEGSRHFDFDTSNDNDMPRSIPVLFLILLLIHLYAWS